MGHGVNRREDIVLDTSFQLRFVERLYDGSPRLVDRRLGVGTPRTPAGKYGRRLDREPGVLDLIWPAYDYREKFFNRGVSVLVTCVNPECLRALVHGGNVGDSGEPLQVPKMGGGR